MNKFIIENTDREEGRIVKVSVNDLANKCNLEIYSGDNNQLITFSTISINRPGLFLSGFDEYFAATRVQVMGNAEMYYLFGMNKEDRKKMLEYFFSKGIPCLILSRGLKPIQDMKDAADKYNIPIFLSSEITSEVVNTMVVYLNRLLAPSITMHGVLININGLGILIAGDSGIGKSETALELIHRGHRLISDDSVIVKRIENELIGQSPIVTKGFMEIRGVGIIDVVRVFGVGAVQKFKDIELIIELEKWKEGKQYDRIGRDIIHTDILGIKIPKILIPVTAGRNLAIVIEVAAGNFRLRQNGYVAADEIEKRMNNTKKNKI